MRDNMPRHSPYSIRLSQAEKGALETQARKYTAPYYLVLRAKIVLLAAQGRPNDEIAASLSVPRQLVSKWRKRFFEQGAAGLEDEPRPERPVTIAPRAGRAVQRSSR
jgi:transposase-like protein